MLIGLLRYPDRQTPRLARRWDTEVHVCHCVTHVGDADVQVLGVEGPSDLVRARHNPCLIPGRIIRIRDTWRHKPIGCLIRVDDGGRDDWYAHVAGSVPFEGVVHLANELPIRSIEIPIVARLLIGSIPPEPIRPLSEEQRLKRIRCIDASLFGLVEIASGHREIVPGPCLLGLPDPRRKVRLEPRGGKYIGERLEGVTKGLDKLARRDGPDPVCRRQLRVQGIEEVLAIIVIVFPGILTVHNDRHDLRAFDSLGFELLLDVGEPNHEVVRRSATG